MNTNGMLSKNKQSHKITSVGGKQGEYKLGDFDCPIKPTA